MSDLREYKCPACGGAIEFDSKSQKMKCPYCDTEFEPETLKELDAQMERVYRCIWIDGNNLETIWQEKTERK